MDDINDITVTEHDLNDLTSLITVQAGGKRYYWRLGMLHYSRFDDRYSTRFDVVSRAARQAVKAIIDEQLGYNISMPDSNEEAMEIIQSTFFEVKHESE